MTADALSAEMRALFGDRWVEGEAVRAAHAGGESVRGACLPAAVAFPERTAEVADILRACNAAKIAVVPFGTGTSLEGQLAACERTISLDLSRMNRIVSIEAEDLGCRVEAGVTREALNLALRDQGLFFPLDPGANASIGGMAATRASGTNAVRYGTMREVVQGLTVVTATGEIMRTGTRARKSSAGYDLTRLMIGSEGTLGVITEVQLRLFGIPERIAAAVAPFATLEDAVAAVTLVLQSGIAIARIELLDSLQMQACMAYSKLEGVAAVPTLFLEFHGSHATVDDQIGQVEAIFADNGGQGFQWAERQEDRNRLWAARHNAYWAARALRPGCESFATDACVPISALAACIAEARQAADALGLLVPVTGHVGDGNFHMLILFDPTSVEERERAEGLSDQVARIALSHGGTISGEHGIGLHKLELMRQEHDPIALATMRAIKHALDPSNILNPGKTVPAVITDL